MRLFATLFASTSVVLGQQLDQGFIFINEETPIRTGSFTSTNNEVTATIKTLHGGQQEGSVLLEVTTPSMTITLIPTRGLNVLRVTDQEGTLIGGWNSGVTEVINPVYMNLMDRAGSGFLAGFSEMVARCGYEYVGHAGEDGDEGLLTLHGKVANIPISSGEIQYIQAENKVVVTGTVYERAFKKSYYTVNMVMEIATNATEFTIRDTLVNEGAYETEYMALYHSNFGPPILSGESTLYIPAREVSPFNEAAQPEVNEWDQLFPPTQGYDETVYNIFPLADADNMTVVGMVNEAASRGIMLTYDISTLPAFSLWKNLDLENHGYVVGLEPGTSFSYNRKFQRDLNLVPRLSAGASVTFEIKYTFLTTSDMINELKALVNNLVEIGGAPSILTDPLSNEQESSDSGKMLTLTSVFAAALLSVLLD